MKLEKILRDDQQVKVIVELEESTLLEFKQKAARKIASRNKIPGFRPGKAPYAVVARSFGEEVIEEQAKELLIDDVYPKMLDEAKITPSGAGLLEEIVSIHPPKFSFVVPLEPEIKLGNYHKLRKAYNPPVVQEKDVEDYLTKMRANYATAEPVERPAQKGDLVYLKLSAKITKPTADEDAEILKETTSQVIIGEENFQENNYPYKNFADEIIGMQAGGEKTTEHTFSEKDASEKFRGKTIAFLITCQSVKSMKYPELDDSFAKMVGGLEKFDDLKTAVRSQLETSSKQDYDRRYFDDLFEEILKSATIKYPPQMLEHEAEHVLESVKEDLAAQKLDLDAYLKVIKKDKATFLKEDIEPAAKKRLERGLIFETFAAEEKIELDKEELSKEFQSTIQDLQYTADFQKLQKKMAPNQLSNAIAMQAANRLMNNRILDRLKDIATGKLSEVNTPKGGQTAPTNKKEVETAKKPTRKSPEKNSTSENKKVTE